MSVSGPRVEDDACGRDDYLMRDAVDPVPVADGRIVQGVEVDVMPCSLETVCHWSFGSEGMLITVSLSRYDSDTALGSGSD